MTCRFEYWGIGVCDRNLIPIPNITPINSPSLSTFQILGGFCITKLNFSPIHSHQMLSLLESLEVRFVSGEMTARATAQTVNKPDRGQTQRTKEEIT